MSGHSKWSTIKHKKAALDAKRGGVFTKLAGAIAVAVKKGGGIGDQEMNFALRLAVEKARAANMPKDNIERAIQKGLGKSNEAEIEELVLEAYGEDGSAIIIEAVTDNRNRTVAEIKNILEKAGGRLGIPGSVMYQFDIVGQILGTGVIEESQELELIDLGIENLDKENGNFEVTVELNNLAKVTNYMREKGFTVTKSSLVYLPKVLNKLDDFQGTQKLIETLSEHDDVQEVYTNAVW